VLPLACALIRILFACVAAAAAAGYTGHVPLEATSSAAGGNHESRVYRAVVARPDADRPTRRLTVAVKYVHRRTDHAVADVVCMYM
jgi:hypothetical protein